MYVKRKLGLPKENKTYRRIIARHFITQEHLSDEAFVGVTDISRSSFMNPVVVLTLPVNLKETLTGTRPTPALTFRNSRREKRKCLNNTDHRVYGRKKVSKEETETTIGQMETHSSRERTRINTVQGEERREKGVKEKYS